jgi:hypothetical protein
MNRRGAETQSEGTEHGPLSRGALPSLSLLWVTNPLTLTLGLLSQLSAPLRLCGKTKEFRL